MLYYYQNDKKLGGFCYDQGTLIAVDRPGVKGCYFPRFVSQKAPGIWLKPRPESGLDCRTFVPSKSFGFALISSANTHSLQTVFP